MLIQLSPTLTGKAITIYARELMYPRQLLYSFKPKNSSWSNLKSG